MDKKFETIVFSTKSYRTNWRDDTEYDKTAMWNDITDVIRILTTQGYQCRVYEEDFHIVVIEYNYKDRSFGGPTLEWLGEDEYICNSEDEVEYDRRIKDDISPAVRGDILRCETEYDERNTFQRDSNGVKIHEGDILKGHEIIGNIYDNPELLEGEMKNERDTF